MITLYLIRHGQTTWNCEQRFQGRFDSDLNDEGLKQMLSVSADLSNAGITRIYTSPLRRAHHSADIISLLISAPVIPVEDLIEIDYGRWQGKTHSEVESSSQALYNRWITHPWGALLPNGEAMDQFYKRVSKSIDHIIGMSEGDSTVAICTHGHVLRAILIHLLKLDQSQFWKITQENGQCSVITSQDGKSWELTRTLVLGNSTLNRPIQST